MPCKSCGHTMGRIGTDAVGAALFWCNRCGSVKSDRTPVEAPKLVERCRQLKDFLFPHGPLIMRGELHDIMRQLGIMESIGK
jgi:hypothetical protein